MSRKSEFDKPLSVDCTRHLLKDFDAAGVVFDEVVLTKTVQLSDESDEHSLRTAR